MRCHHLYGTVSNGCVVELSKKEEVPDASAGRLVHVHNVAFCL